MNRPLSVNQSVRLGLVVLSAVLLAGWGMLQIAKQGRNSSGETVRVHLADANELELGSPVKVRGMDAGIVEAISTAEGGEFVEVRLRMGHDFARQLKSDASAMVSTKGLLGGGVLRVDPGHAKSAWTGQPIPGQSAPDLQTVAAKLDRLAGEAEQLLSSVRKGEGTVGKLLKDETLYNDLNSIAVDAKKLVHGADQSMQDVRKEMDKVRGLIRNGSETLASIRQNSDALKGLPIIRSYVEDPVSILVRPNVERQRDVYPIDYLFEPGKAILSLTGRQKLLDSVSRLNRDKTSQTEIVVAVFADPADIQLPAGTAKKLTDLQAEAIVEYLKEHNCHRISWISSRTIKPMGMGQNPSPVQEKEALPAGRAEVILFPLK